MIYRLESAQVLGDLRGEGEIGGSIAHVACPRCRQRLLIHIPGTAGRFLAHANRRRKGIRYKESLLYRNGELHGTREGEVEGFVQIYLHRMS